MLQSKSKALPIGLGNHTRRTESYFSDDKKDFQSNMHEQVLVFQTKNITP